MANTFELIASSTVGSGGAANIDFTSIPATYTDLVVIASLRPVGSGFDGVTMIFNNDSTSTRYTNLVLRGNGSAVISFIGGNTTRFYCGELSPDTANTFNNLQVYVPNYLGSTQKSISVDSVGENNATTAYQVLNAGIYNQTTAISRITLGIASSDIAQYSTAYLYGVKNA